jgi:hypothetical protein
MPQRAAAADAASLPTELSPPSAAVSAAVAAGSSAGDAVPTSTGTEAEWEKLIQTRLKQIITQARIAHWQRNRCTTHWIEEKKRTIELNVRAHIAQARKLGCVGPHHDEGGCPGPFTPEKFFRLTEFAHYWALTAKKQLTGTGLSRLTTELLCSTHTKSHSQFLEFLKTGTSKWTECHHAETVARGEYNSGQKQQNKN